MNTRKIRLALFALLASATATFGLTACDTGTQPGDTNVERSDHHDEGSMVSGETGDEVKAERDSMEQHYERTEEGSAVHAGNGKGEVTNRDDAKKDQ